MSRSKTRYVRVLKEPGIERKHGITKGGIYRVLDEDDAATADGPRVWIISPLTFYRIGLLADEYEFVDENAWRH